MPLFMRMGQLWSRTCRQENSKKKLTVFYKFWLIRDSDIRCGLVTHTLSNYKKERAMRQLRVGRTSNSIHAV